MHTEKTFAEMLSEVIEENEYIEDSYGEEIKIGDKYYVTENGELIHEKSLKEYALDVLPLHEKTR